MNKKLLIFIVILGGMLLLGRAVSLSRQTFVSSDRQEFSLIANTDAGERQSRTTEYFSIEFPQDWYWLESGNSGYRADILTNNKNLDVANQYPDIAFYDKGIMGRSEKEVMITFRGWPTQERDDPQMVTEEIIKRQFRDISNMMRDQYEGACNIMASDRDPILKCNRFDSGQTLKTYYIVNRAVTISMTARKNSISTEESEAFDRIAQSIIVRKD